MSRRIGWLDCGSGVSGDMLLGALVAAGVPIEVLSNAIDAVAPERLKLHVASVQRNGLAARHVRIEGTDSTHHRTWTDVRKLLETADLDGGVRAKALDTFRRLAEAEAKVHDTTPEHIHFHEVGALDAIADVVGVCAGLAHLGLDTPGALHASPIAVGSGFVRAAHGKLPVPVPAVVELLASERVPSYAGEIEPGTPVGELCTPTGAALLLTHVHDWGAQPPMHVAVQGFGAGTRDTKGRANVVRLIVGEVLDARDQPSTQLVIETNVDDLDPRIWPAVLQRLLDAGAADAWLTPILMKKGRPAHQLSVLTDLDNAEAVRRVVFTETSAIGLRSHTVAKQPLVRQFRTVELPGGGEVRVKIASYDGRIVNVQPEYDDVLAVAEQTNRPVKVVLAEARSAISQLRLAFD